MANHDPISDMLTRIRNASEKRHENTRVPSSRLCRSIAQVLQQEGFIANISEEGEGVRKELVLELKYSGKHRQPTIRRMQRVSKPGLRIYKSTRQLPKVLRGLGVEIIYTTRGVMRRKEKATRGYAGHTEQEVTRGGRIL
jgi:small subunit ribosomal protein S8